MPRQNSKIQLRNWWLKIHRWVGLFMLILSLPIGITGSINVYHREIDAWLNPDMFWRHSSGEQSLPLKELLARARAADSAPVISMILPDPFWSVLWVHQRQPDKSVTRTAIDPGTGEIQAKRVQRDALLPKLYQLHANLLLKPYWGEELVGVVGIALALSCVSGLWLWWPKPGKFRRAVTVQRGLSWYRWSWEFHNALGFWTSAVLLVVALSGIYLVFPKAVRQSLYLGRPPAGFKPSSVEAAGAACDDPDQILAVAVAHRPQDHPMVLILPNPKLNTWRVAMRPTSYHAARGGAIQVWVDPYRLKVHQEVDDAKRQPGDQLLALQLSIHNGSLASEAGRILVFLSGLAFPILGLTGAYVWWHKRGLQQRAAKVKRERAKA